MLYFRKKLLKQYYNWRTHMRKGRLQKQIDFIVEIDKVKQIYRRNLLMDGTRNENDAEHSWHLAMMAILLAEYSSEEKIDISKVIKMVLVHDLVEIYAGDTYCYDEKANEDKREREELSAERIFGILPEDQGAELKELWEEFERRESSEAKFAASLDRLQPLIHNYKTKGVVWLKNEITSDRVLKRNEPTEEIAPALWELTEDIIEDSVNKGYLIK
jgi:putative hydrolases of HD superfamily